MDVQIPASAAPISTKNIGIGNEDSQRCNVTFHPTIWGDYFLKYSSNEISSNEEQELQRLKEEVKKQLAVIPDDSLHKLDLIDAIQRLRVGYHFETEIGKYLESKYGTYNKDCGKQDNDDLRALALRFRLLRRQGYRVSSGVFKKFQDGQGNFEESLIGNVQGLLSLYEAAQYRVHGEEILEEALKFSTSHLESIKGHSRQVSDALKMPIHKTLTRVGAKTFFSIYQEDESHNDLLLNFAKLDFNLLQRMHQKEISEITRWWNAFEVEETLPFARSRLVECYFWILGVYFEPRFSLARKILTKIIAMTSILDDIYDNYGTVDELALLSDAIERWSFNAIDQLPAYMKLYYKSLLEVYVEIKEDVRKIGGEYRVTYAINEVKKISQAYFQEAKWKYDEYIPTLEEYMKVALVSCGYMLLSTGSLLGMGELVTKEVLNWMSSEPLFVRAASVVNRLMDDVVGKEFEQKVTAVECYMNQEGASEEEAFLALQQEVENAWKDINEQCLMPTPVPMAILMRVINLARVMDLLFQDGDGYSDSKTKFRELINDLFVEPAVTM